MIVSTLLSMVVATYHERLSHRTWLCKGRSESCRLRHGSRLPCCTPSTRLHSCCLWKRCYWQCGWCLPVWSPCFALWCWGCPLVLCFSRWTGHNVSIGYREWIYNSQKFPCTVSRGNVAELSNCFLYCWQFSPCNHFVTLASKLLQCENCLITRNLQATMWNRLMWYMDNLCDTCRNLTDTYNLILPFYMLWYYALLRYIKT